MNEFDLIAEIKARAPVGSGVVLGIGDDAAVLQPSDGMQLVATTDNVVAGRHFDEAAAPGKIGHLALAVNLSDLATMGAIPRWCLLTLTLPEADTAWVEGFLDGFLALAAEYDCALVGGNIARGPLDVGVTVLGEVEAGRFATRMGAQPGDRIVVTGTLGDAGCAWKHQVPPEHPLRERLLRPAARIAAGRELAPIARAMIDVSDGLLADLGHLLSGGVGAEIRCDRLPASPELLKYVPEPAARWRLQLAGGSDYELLAAVGPDREIPAEIGGIALTEIGRVTDSGRLVCLDDRGQVFEPAGTGWDHFLE